MLREIIVFLFSNSNHAFIGKKNIYFDKLSKFLSLFLKFYVCIFSQHPSFDCGNKMIIKEVYMMSLLTIDEKYGLITYQTIVALIGYIEFRMSFKISFKIII